MTAASFRQLCLDANDVEAMGRFWGAALGLQGMPFDALVFGWVPEPKTVKNRIHWDVATPDLGLLTGATLLREPDDEIDWTVLADPEGNEFCAVVEEGV